MKVKTQFTCSGCGHMSTKWLGRCPTCDQWNTFVEETLTPQSGSGASGGARADRDATLELAGVKRSLRSSEFVSLDPKFGEEVLTSDKRRVTTGLGELDRVLGGGMVPDSFILLGGDPGIGKSTLLLQAADGLLRHNPQLKILYASGEESIEQIRGRARRIAVGSEGARDRMFLSAENQIERVFSAVKELKPQVLVIDSIQTFATTASESAPGSVTQIREVAARLMQLAKSAGICVWMVGHVTKEGAIAGPKVVEHMVDTVLYFEAESGQSYRLLRAVKNRFGSSRELGIFEMEAEGLREVSNPSSLFLSERTESVSGTAICASIEGSRPLLIELQALVTSSALAMPRRTAVGLESARLALLAAILEKHARLKLGSEDLFFNVSGGLRLSEPACDLAAAAAIWSSAEGHALRRDWIFMGELGLTGEVRRVSQPEVRIEEAHKLGFKAVVLPRSTLERVERFQSRFKGMHLLPISRIEELPKVIKL